MAKSRTAKTESLSLQEMIDAYNTDERRISEEHDTKCKIIEAAVLSMIRQRFDTEKGD